MSSSALHLLDLVRRAGSPVVGVTIAGCALMIYLVGGFRLVDDALHDWRQRTLDLAASGEIVVVEVDATSLRRLGQWPWPRSHHAMVLDRLIAAGAARVGFDVSFSSPADPADDNRLAAAAARAGDRLILPTFRQGLARADGGVDLIVDRPMPRLAAAARMASINVHPDGDGIVRRLPYEDAIDGATLPFISTALLGDHAPDLTAPYLLDFGIDPRTLPRLSFADILIGDFDPAIVEGRSVLVGATAVELGDVLAVPRWGNLAGPLVIAIGFESLLQDRAIRPLDAWWFVAALCLAAALAPAWGRADKLQAAVIPAALQLAGLVALGEALYLYAAIKFDLAPVAAALLMAHGLELGRALRAQARRIAAQNREAERRRALLRSVVDTSIDAVVIADRAGAVQLANPACHSVFGYAPEELAGREISTLIDPGDRLAAKLRNVSGADDVVAALRFPVDIWGLHRDGSTLELELAMASTGAASQADQAAAGDRHVIYVFRDVSDQRQLEAMRRQALQAQVEAERVKADFLATASHELRTPLNHINGFASLLAAGIGGALSDKQREYVADIETATAHLTGIVTDILDYADEAGSAAEGERKAVPVGALIDGARRQVADLASRRNVAITVANSVPDAALVVDRETTERALMHVLRNAVQFSAEGDVVSVIVRRRRAAPMLRIAISDNGPGMNQQQIAHVLTDFGQVEGAMAREHGGMGVGLNLASRCLEQHGGGLHISSAAGKGTTVDLDFPLPEAIDQPARSAA